MVAYRHPSGVNIWLGVQVWLDRGLALLLAMAILIAGASLQSSVLLPMAGAVGAPVPPSSSQ